MKIKLIIGLGNPGEEYEKTRHNIGFLFVNGFAKHFNAGSFKYDKKTNSDILKTSKLILAKPQTFMNKSGAAVSALSKILKIKPENILVVHDDIDILWEKSKLSFGRSSAGHKGVESIIKALKTKNFWRLRIGIQPTIKKHTSAEKIILKKFTPSELQNIEKIVENFHTSLISN